VTGANFVSLHKLFRKQYTQLFEYLDMLSENIRARGKKIPTNWHAIDANIQAQDTSTMLSVLIDQYTKLLETIEEEKDFGDLEEPLTTSTNKILDDIAHFADKQRWMLRALQEEA
jgi:DNA-binding ferritin-like protein